ncbi:MAG: hypothetical protein ABI880_09535 [Acidobacteriota bacterium]
MQDLQDVGLAPGELERVFSWWHRFGGRKALMLAFAVTLPLLRYEYIPHVLSTTVETLAEGYGLHLTVREWETSLSDIKITGRDVVITTGGPFREKRLFTANAVEFDWSLMRAVANGARRVSGCWTAVFGRPCTVPDEIFHRVSIDGAALHLERSLSGAWNTEDAFRVSSLEGLSEAVGRWRIPTIEGEDISVSWVEHLPGASGGGLVEQRFSSLDFTKVSVSVADLQVPVDDRENPTRFTFEGQTADGVVSVTGDLNLSRWAKASWTPSYDLKLRLVNVGAATFARFASPDATVVPTSGQVDGEIRLVRGSADADTCSMAVTLRNVTYGANPRSPFARATGARLDQELEPVRISDTVSVNCAAAPGAGPEQRATQRLQTLLTTNALRTAPPVVQRAAGFDQVVMLEGRTPTADEITRLLTTRVGLAVAGEKGAAVVQALTADPATNGNVVSRGARSVGRGFKRLFGGGDNKAAATKKPAPKKPG